MIVREALVAQAPAQVHVASFETMGKVDQRGLDALGQRAELHDALQALIDALREELELGALNRCRGVVGVVAVLAAAQGGGLRLGLRGELGARFDRDDGIGLEAAVEVLLESSDFGWLAA